MSSLSSGVWGHDSQIMDALVVSRETVAGAEQINKLRAVRGWAPVALVVVDLVGATEQEPTAAKLSSSALRAADAAAGMRGEGEGDTGPAR